MLRRSPRKHGGGTVEQKTPGKQSPGGAKSRSPGGTKHQAPAKVKKSTAGPKVDSAARHQAGNSEVGSVSDIVRLTRSSQRSEVKQVQDNIESTNSRRSPRKSPTKAAEPSVPKKTTTVTVLSKKATTKQSGTRKTAEENKPTKSTTGKKGSKKSKTVSNKEPITKQKGSRKTRTSSEENNSKNTRIKAAMGGKQTKMTEFCGLGRKRRRGEDSDQYEKPADNVGKTAADIDTKKSNEPNQPDASTKKAKSHKRGSDTAEKGTECKKPKMTLESDPAVADMVTRADVVADSSLAPDVAGNLATKDPATTSTPMDEAADVDSSPKDADDSNALLKDASADDKVSVSKAEDAVTMSTSTGVVMEPRLAPSDLGRGDADADEMKTGTDLPSDVEMLTKHTECLTVDEEEQQSMDVDQQEVEEDIQVPGPDPNVPFPGSCLSETKVEMETGTSTSEKPAEATPEVTDLCEKPAETTPEVTDLSEKPAETTPEITDLSEKPAETTPEITDLSEKPAETTPEITDLSEKPAESTPAISDTSEKATETTLEVEVTGESEKEAKMIPEILVTDTSEIEAETTPEILVTDTSEKPAETTPEVTDTSEKPAETTPEVTDISEKPAETTPEITGTSEKEAETTPEITDTSEKPAETTPEVTDTSEKKAETTPEITDTSEKEAETTPEITDTSEKEAETTPEISDTPEKTDTQQTESYDIEEYATDTAATDDTEGVNGSKQNAESFHGSDTDEEPDLDSDSQEASMWRDQLPRKKTTHQAKPRLRSKWSDVDTEEYRNGYPGKQDNPSMRQNFLFYTNKLGSKPDGCRIGEFHDDWWGDYQRLERQHGYIQWLFPIREKGMNFQSQELQLHEAQDIKKDKSAKVRVLQSYEMMLDFYGIRLVDPHRGVLERAENWRERFAHLNRSFHNYLRITRILKSLGELGYEYLKAPFVEFILNEAFVEGTLTNCQKSCSDYWVHTLRDEDERIQLAEKAEEYMEEYPSQKKHYYYH